MNQAPFPSLRTSQFQGESYKWIFSIEVEAGIFCMTQKGKTKTNGCILPADGFQFDVKNSFLLAEVVKGK